ncbi:unnamed protein product [Urochloa decumbens]|uniref:Uncharacterized protein n=1 Tax=Urochloa decumbens TaxID=240449 RepID=A0ABC9FPJ0_9POAL
MAMSTPLVRLVLPLLLLLLPPALRDYQLASHQPKIHPVVLVPGMGCSDLEARLTEEYRPSVPRCGAMKGKGWFELWKNISDLEAHDYMYRVFDCFLEQMHLFYDPTTNEYRNLPGVETRVPNFGSPRGFRNKNPLHSKQCFDKVREGLERLGYRDGDNLFGAPYDWRYAPPLPRQPSKVYSSFFKEFKALVEAASTKHHRKVTVVGHSYGGMVALEFVRNTPLAWRNEYIKHLILVAPTLSEGFLNQLVGLATGPSDLTYIGATALSLRPMWRSFETSIVDLPSPDVFGHKPLVITERRNYSAHDMEVLLAAIGFAHGVEPFRRRMVPKMHYFQAPMVPMTCINGVGNRTPKQLVFWEGDYDRAPEMVYGDGDGYVNLISMLAFDKKMRQQPGQKNQFKSIKIDGAQHSGIITEEWTVKRVIHEILEANK